MISLIQKFQAHSNAIVDIYYPTPSYTHIGHVANECELIYKTIAFLFLPTFQEFYLTKHLK